MFDFLMPSKVDAWFGFWCLNSDTVALFLIVLGWKGSVGLHPSWLFLVQWDAFDQTNGRKILAVLNSSSILVLHVYILVSCGWEKKKLIAKAPVDFSYGNSVDCCVVTGNLEDYNLLRLWKFSKELYCAADSMAQFRSRKFCKRTVDSPSHQIFRRMHEALNIDKK
jgi:hypothetical protein